MRNAIIQDATSKNRYITKLEMYMNLNSDMTKLSVIGLNQSEQVLMEERRYLKSKINNSFVRLRILFLRSLFLVVFISMPVYGATYYVDASNGNNSNPGTEAEPWLTIQHAADTMVAGDTVYIKQGIYEEIVDLTGSTGVEGESGNEADGHITYQSYPGNNVVLDGSEFQVQDWGCAFMSGRWAEGSRAMDYIKISNLTIRNYPEAGIEFNRESDGKGSHHIILEDLIVHNNAGIGICIWGGIESAGTTHNIEVNNCESYNNCDHGFKFNGDDEGVIDGEHIHDSIIENCVSHDNLYIGIHASTGNYNITVRNNTCYNNGRQGIAAHEIWDSVYENNTIYGNGTSGGDENEGMIIWNSKNMIIRCNRIYDNPGYGLMFWEDLVDTGSSPTMENNVIFNNLEGGIGIYTDVDNGKIYHNTIALNQGTGLHITTSVSGYDIKNNIIYQNSYQLMPGNGNTFDYNLYYPDISFIGKGPHSITGDPLFVDPSNPIYDFHLQSTSPAIDSGTDVGTDTDIEGTSRPQGAGYDIGAYEYYSTSLYDDFNGAVSLNITLYRNFPNPFNQLTWITYEISTACDVLLEIFDVTGRKVDTLVDSWQNPGVRNVVWNASGVTSGVYFYRFLVQGENCARKMIVLE